MAIANLSAGSKGRLAAYAESKAGNISHLEVSV